jgi:hypothetical protein
MGMTKLATIDSDALVTATGGLAWPQPSPTFPQPQAPIGMPSIGGPSPFPQPQFPVPMPNPMPSPFPSPSPTFPVPSHPNAMAAK